jgi:hypothetical protein
MDSFWMRGAPVPLLRRALRLLWLAALCVVSLRCGDDGGQTTVTVAVEGLTADLASMTFNATLSGRELVSEAPIISPTDSLTLQIALTETGLLDLTVSGLDSSGCQLAAGAAQLMLSGDTSYSATVTLSFDSLNKG